METELEPFAPRVGRNFKHWSFHCAINALPSFLIAGLYLGLFQNPAAVAAMLAAVACFIVIYTALTSFVAAFAQSQSPLGQCLKWGKRCRLVISLGSLPALIHPGFVMLMPDFWCGMAASGLVSQVWPGSDPTDQQGPVFYTFIITLTEGILLSAMLFLLSLSGLAIVRSKTKVAAVSRRSGESAR